MKKSLEERFWEKVQKGEADECWLWLGAFVKKIGYGQIRVNSRKVYAHRYSYALHYGIELRDDSLVLHSCDNPKCVNPHHLFMGTQADNMRDMIQKGRQKIYRGNASNLARYTESDFHKVLELHAKGLPQSEIVKATGISQAHVSRILNNKHRYQSEEQ